MSLSEQAPPIAAPLEDVRTERLDLGRFEREDVGELAAVFAHPEVWHFPYGRGFTRQETEEFVASRIAERDEVGFSSWLARTVAERRIIGYVGLSVPTFLPEVLPAVEVAWRLAPWAWGKGYATEGATAALDQAFTRLGLDRVLAVVQAANVSSVRVVERLGMSLLRQVTIPPTERRGQLTGLIYEIDREHWQASRSQRGHSSLPSA